MTVISQAVQDAIQQNLPGAVANEMQAFIEQAKATEAELKRTKDLLTHSNRTITEKNAQLEAHGELAKRETAVAEREKNVQACELVNLQNAAKLEATQALAELKGVKETMGAFLANVTVRTAVQSQVGVPVQGQPGGNGYSPSCGFVVPSTETHVTTETKE